MNDDNGSNTWHRFGGLLAPKATLSYPFDTMDKPYLSLLSMLIPTNDAFVGMDSIEIPTEPGTYTYYLNAYDADTDNAAGASDLDSTVHRWSNAVPRESALLRR